MVLQERARWMEIKQWHNRTSDSSPVINSDGGLIARFSSRASECTLYLQAAGRLEMRKCLRRILSKPLGHICRSVWEHEPRQGSSLQLLLGALYPPVPMLPGASEKPAGTKGDELCHLINISQAEDG
jgi:predicted acetyltransferase